MSAGAQQEDPDAKEGDGGIGDHRLELEMALEAIGSNARPIGHGPTPVVAQAVILAQSPPPGGGAVESAPRSPAIPEPAYPGVGHT